MASRLILFAALGALFSGAASAECVMEGAAPAMPDAETATSEDVSATVSAIRQYQGELGTYRDCLDGVMQNVELEIEERQAAQDAYNATVEDETAMVEAWRAFAAAYEEKNG